MRFSSVLKIVVCGLGILTAALENAVSGNWSVKLMADLRPEDLTEAQWNGVVDAMITRSEAYVCDFIRALDIFLI